jgi:hypothetical protein
MKMLPGIFGRRVRVITWGAIAALCAAVAGCRGASSAAPHVTWQESRRYLYSARLTSRAALGADSPFAFDLTAKLELVPLRVAGPRVELALLLSNPQLKVGGGRVLPESDSLVAALTKPYLFTLEGGRIVEQRFSPGIPTVAAAIHRSLGAAYQLAVPPPRAKKWTASEYDTTGEYQAEYVVAGDRGTVTKRKLLYKGTIVAGKMDSATRARVAAKIVGSSGELRITDGTLATVRLEDAVESQVLAKMPLTVQTKLAIDLDATSPAPAAGPDRAALLAQTIAHPMGQAYGDGHANGLFDRARYDGRTFEQLLGELEAEAKDTKAGELWQGRNGSPIPDAERAGREGRLGRRVTTFSSLVALLRLQPDVVGKAAAEVRAGSTAAPALMDGLAAAGSDEAQAALAGLVLDPKLARGLKVAGATSLVRVQRPGPQAIETLKSLLHDPLFQEHATFGLGTMAHRLREGGDIARAQEISALLVELLGSAKKPDDQIRCLRGIANSAYAGALEPVRPFLAAADPGVRRAAVEATRLMDDPGVDAFIAGPMTKDTDAGVRTAAVQVAARQAPSAVLEAALAEVALHDDNVDARQHAVELLGRWLATRRNLRPTLEQVVSRDAQPQVRAAAKAALEKA